MSLLGREIHACFQTFSVEIVWLTGPPGRWFARHHLLSLLDELRQFKDQELNHPKRSPSSSYAHHLRRDGQPYQSVSTDIERLPTSPANVTIRSSTYARLLLLDCVQRILSGTGHTPPQYQARKGPRSTINHEARNQSHTSKNGASSSQCFESQYSRHR